MGCMKSKQISPFPTMFETERRHESEENFMPDERCVSRMPSPVTVPEEVKKSPAPTTVITDYAERLSKQILHDALQEWARNNIRNYNIPHIKSEGPDTIG